MIICPVSYTFFVLSVTVSCQLRYNLKTKWNWIFSFWYSDHDNLNQRFTKFCHSIQSSLWIIKTFHIIYVTDRTKIMHFQCQFIRGQEKQTWKKSLLLVSLILKHSRNMKYNIPSSFLPTGNGDWRWYRYKWTIGFFVYLISTC